MQTLNLVALILCLHKIYAYISKVHANDYHIWPNYPKNYYHNANSGHMMPQYNSYGYGGASIYGQNNYNHLAQVNQYGNEQNYFHNGAHRLSEPSRYTDLSGYKRQEMNYRKSHSKFKAPSRKLLFLGRLILSYLCHLRHRLH